MRRPSDAPIRPAPRPPSGRSRLGGDCDSRARVDAYFAAVDRLQTGETGDASGLARTLLSSGLQGDMSGMDELTNSAARITKQVAALDPPSIAREYHDAVVELLGESQALLALLHGAIRDQKTENLSQVGERARVLQSRTNRLESMRRDAERAADAEDAACQRR